MNNGNFDQGILNAKFFCTLGISHTLKLNTNTCHILPQGGKKLTFTDNGIPVKYMGFIKQVKATVRKSDTFSRNYEYLSKLTSSDVTYIKANSEKIGYYDDVTEIDINGAYWNCAYLLGYITKEVYEKALATDKNGVPLIPKQIRLIALGSLAATYSVREFEKGSGYTFMPIQRDPELSGVFFHIAKHVGELMSLCVEQMGLDSFMLFWVDAFICNSISSKYVTEYFNNLGYEVKEKKYRYLDIVDTNRGKVGYACERSKISATINVNKYTQEIPKVKIDRKGSTNLAYFKKVQRSRKKPFTLSASMNSFIKVEEFIRRINEARRTNSG